MPQAIETLWPKHFVYIGNSSQKITDMANLTNMSNYCFFQIPVCAYAKREIAELQPTIKILFDCILKFLSLHRIFF